MGVKGWVETLKNNKRVKAVGAFAVKNQKKLKIWALIIVCGAMVLKGIMQQPQILSNKDQIARLNDQLVYEQTRSEEVERLKEMVGTDEYIEKIAREKLGLIKQNEKIFIDVAKQD